MEGRWRQVLRVVRHPQLRRLQAAFGLFAIAENATWIAVTVFAYARGGVREAGVVAVVQLAPAVVIAPFAAFAGDRFRRDVVLAAGYVAQSVAMLATAVAMWGDAPEVAVYAAATTAAVAVTFTRPAMGALLPATTTSPADLTAAHVSLGVLEHLGVFLGPAIAGVLLHGGGAPERVFAVMGVAMAAAALTVSRLDLDRALVDPQEGVDAVDAADVVHDALGGFRTLRDEPDLRLLVIVMAVSAVLVGAGDILFVVVADGLLEPPSPARAGVLGAAFGLGALSGALGSVALVGRSRLTLPLGAAVVTSGAALALIGAMSHLVAVFGLFMVAGAGESVARIAGASLVQRVAPAAMLSRVFGVMEGLQMAALAIGATVVSVLVDWLGVRAGLVVMGLLVPALLATRATRLLRIDADAPAPRRELVRLIAANPIFAPLPPPTLEGLLAALESHELPAGHVVVRQGDEGDRYYLVERGELTVTVDGVVVRVLGPDSGFGEIALLRDVPRTSTVTTITPVLLHSVRRTDFLTAVSGHPAGLGAAHDVAQRLLDDDASRPRPRAPGETRMSEQDIEVLVRSVPGWADVDVTITPITAGITNRNYRVDVAGEVYVVRIPGERTTLLGIDRAAEAELATRAAAMGIGPAVLGELPGVGTLVTSFVPGQPADQRSMRAGDTIERVVGALRILHASGPLTARFPIFRVVERHARDAAANGVDVPSGFADLHRAATTIEAVFDPAELAATPCHNDLLPANVLVGGDRLWLIDYEYAGMNHALFDLANLSVNGGFDAAEDERMLRTYGGDVSVRDLARLRLMKVMSEFREGMWAVVQQAISTLTTIDFEAYADERLTHCRELVAAPDFGAALFEATRRSA